MENFPMMNLINLAFTKILKARKILEFWGDVEGSDIDKLWMEFPHPEYYPKNVIIAISSIYNLKVPYSVRMLAITDFLLMLENEEYAKKCAFRKDLLESEFPTKYPKIVFLLFDWNASLLGYKFWSDLNYFLI